MPLYEYQCHRCGKKFEVIEKFSDTPLTVHPDCGGEVERLISAPSLQFKGTGWYVTDYGRKGGNSAGSGDSNGKSTSESSKGESSRGESSKADSSKSDSSKSDSSKSESSKSESSKSEKKSESSIKTESKPA